MSETAEHTILVGKSHPKFYAAAAASAFANGASRVVLKARGRAISRAVDISQIVSRVPGVRIGPISIGSERRVQKDGRARDLSTIEIIMELESIPKKALKREHPPQK